MKYYFLLILVCFTIFVFIAIPKDAFAITDSSYNLNLYQGSISGPTSGNDIILYDLSRILYDLIIPVNNQGTSSSSSGRKHTFDTRNDTQESSEPIKTNIDSVIPLNTSANDNTLNNAGLVKVGNYESNLNKELLDLVNPKYSSDIKALVKDFILNGSIDPLTFEPYARLKRAEVLKIILTTFSKLDPQNLPVYKKNSFLNVKENYPYYSYIEYAYRNGLLKDEYRGEALVFNKFSTFSRFETMQILFLVSGIIENSEFSDIDSVKSDRWKDFSKKYKGALFIRTANFNTIKLLKAISEVKQVYKAILGY